MSMSKVDLYTHTQPFNGPLSGATQVGRYQKNHSPIHTHDEEGFEPTTKSALSQRGLLDPIKPAYNQSRPDGRLKLTTSGFNRLWINMPAVLVAVPTVMQNSLHPISISHITARHLLDFMAQITEADTLTICLDATQPRLSVLRPPSSPHFMLNAVCQNPPNLSRLGTGTE